MLMIPPEINSYLDKTKEEVYLIHTALSQLNPSSYFGFTLHGGGIQFHVEPSIDFESSTVNEFLKQDIIYYHGEYCTRQELIKFAANKMGGAHHGNKEIKNEDLISKANGCISFTQNDNGSFNIKVELERILNTHEKTYPNKNAITLVHLEILSSARLISHCPYIQHLKVRLIELLGQTN